MRGKYVVDWDDESYPAIRRAVEGDPPSAMQSFSACKAEIYQRANDEISHWRAQMEKFRAMRLGDVQLKDTTETEGSDHE